MLSTEIAVSRSDIPSVSIGRSRTHNTRKVVFDFSALVREFGEGTFTLLFVRPGESPERPIAELEVPLEITGNKAVWTVSDRDTEITGSGEAECMYHNTGFCYKTNVFTVSVNRAIA